MGWQMAYSQRREAQQRALRQREETVRARWTGLDDWKQRRSRAQVARGLAESRGQDADRQQQEELLLALQQEAEQALRALGMEKNMLTLHYDCPHCQDYGMVNGQPCHCLKEFQSRQRMQLDGEVDYDRQSFEQFDLSMFPVEDGQRNRIERVRQLCETYAQACPQVQPLNLLLLGNSGLGKSFLLNCIGKRLLERHVRMQRITAYRFHQVLMSRVISGESQRPLRELAEVDVLLFDDLGCEPQTNKSLTESYFVALLDERMAARRPTVITTNYTDHDLQNRYGERGVSRLFDQQNGRVIALRGRDLRLISSKEQQQIRQQGGEMA